MSNSKAALKPGQQAGAALLLFVLVILAGASFALLTKLDSAVNRFTRDYSSMDALQEAKAALIGYAVTYPDTHLGHGPGFLPCPDRDNDGATDRGSCALNPNATTIGRLPYETLEISRVMDHSGEVLWYAVADNYRNNPKTRRLNSDTPGNFEVDTRDDIVAVIFAPGPPIAAQSRGTKAERRDVANYLEGDNADKDVRFVTQSGAVQDLHYHEKFNDRLLVITRQELMQAVEKRVLGDVAKALIAYQARNGSYPWLSPFANPSASLFRGAAGTIQGHLAYHYSRATKAAGEPNQFNTGLALRWERLKNTAPVQLRKTWNSRDIGEDMYNSSVPLIDCLFDIKHCDEGGLFPKLASLPAKGEASCTWPDKNSWPDLAPASYKDTFVCAPLKATVTSEYRSHTCRATASRFYFVNFPAFTGTASETRIEPATANSIRTRAVSYEGYLPAKRGAIGIIDTYEGTLYNHKTGACDEGTLRISASIGLIKGKTTGKLTASGIHYDMDVDKHELPAWFVEHGWQNLIYIAYADGEPVPGTGEAKLDCKGPDAACLTVSVNGVLRDQIHALALSAGADLKLARPGGGLRVYLEGDNNNLDASFEKNRITAEHNDQLRIIATVP